MAASFRRTRYSSSRTATRFALSWGAIWVEGVSGFGGSVHEALRDLADNLVREGIWIEVTDRNEWHFEELPDIPDE